MAAAAAAMVAAAARHVIFRGRTAELECLGYILANGLLQIVHGLLRVEKAARDGVVNKDVAMLLKLVDFALLHRSAHLPFLLEPIVAVRQGLVLGFGLFVGHKGRDLSLERLEFGLRDDCIAKLARFLDDYCFFSRCGHNSSTLRRDVHSQVRLNTPQAMGKINRERCIGGFPQDVPAQNSLALLSVRLLAFCYHV